MNTNDEQTQDPHPPRRPGQRYMRPGGRIATLVALTGEGWRYSPVDPNGEYIVDREWMDANWTLLADAPPAVDRSGCKAWCGALAPDGPGTQRNGSMAYWGMIDDRYDVAAKGPHWCDYACRDARLPPIAPAREEAPTWVPGMPNEPRPPLGKPKVAANALPVCWMLDCKRTPILRHLKGRAEHICDPCYLELEEDRARCMSFDVVPSIEAIRRAPPEPEPLAIVDWLDDWLPEAGR